jgi:hypothetical protein
VGGEWWFFEESREKRVALDGKREGEKQKTTETYRHSVCLCFVSSVWTQRVERERGNASNGKRERERESERE